SARIRKPVKTVFCADEAGITTCYQYNWEDRGLPHEITERPDSGARPGKKTHRTGYERPAGYYRSGPADARTHPDPRGSRGFGVADRRARSFAHPDGKSAAYERRRRPPGSLRA